MNEKIAPVKEGDIVDVEIINLGAKGDGVAKVEGFIVIVPGAKVDEKLRVKVSKVLPKYAFAEITE